jgi:hypothetical protein
MVSSVMKYYKLDNSANGTHSSVSVSTLNGFTLLSAAFRSTTIYRERNLAFP